MSDQNLGDLSRQQANGSSLSFAQLREFTTDALRYWELRRIFYNLLLAVIVVSHFVAAWPGSRAYLTVNDPLGLFLLAVLANIAYSAVYVADVFIQISGFRASRGRWRRLLLLVGFAFAGVLTHFFASGMFGAGRSAE
jgi:hypothetical protein